MGIEGNTDCILHIFSYLDRESLSNLAHACRTAHKQYHKLFGNDENQVLTFRILVNDSKLGALTPQPDYLISLVASQIGRWAMQSDANAHMFAKYCRRGMWGLLDLALGPAKCKLSFRELDKWRHMRRSAMHHVTDLIDRCVGAQWNATPDFWDGGVSDPITITACATMTYYQLCLYGELFLPALKSCILSEDGSVPLYAQPEIRLTAVRGLFSDRPFQNTDEVITIRRTKDDTQTPLSFSDSLPETFTKPTWKDRSNYDNIEGGDRMLDNILAIRHLLYTTKFTEAFRQLSEDLSTATGTGAIGDTVYYNRANQLKIESLWVSCLLLSGNEGMLHFGRSIGREDLQISEDWAKSLKELWEKLKYKKRKTMLNKEYVSARQHFTVDGLHKLCRIALWPDLLGDMNILMQAE